MAQPMYSMPEEFTRFNTQYSFLYDHFGIAFLVRAVLVIYGEFHDQVFHLNYTDIDYRVFSDAAQWVSLDKSPYNRDGYRYTPLLSYMLLPNMWIHPAFGKILFAAFDILAAYITFLILQKLKIDDSMMKLCVLLALYNPVAINVSTRGNAESVMSVLCLLTLWYHESSKFIHSGIVFGLSVHFKIYPVCYALPLYFWCSQPKHSINRGWKRLVDLCWPNRDKLTFTAAAAATFLSLNVLFYALYGKEFLNETYFYHLSRRDIQHNFSPYFYIMRMTKGMSQERILNFMPFVPQILLWLRYSLEFYTDLPFVCFLNTAVFVILNKVCTVQYFMWYLTFLPLVLPKIDLPRQRIIYLVASWFSSMAFWLGSAYLLEFQQRDIVILVWLASMFFMFTNLAILFQITSAYNGLVPVPVKPIKKDKET